MARIINPGTLDQMSPIDSDIDILHNVALISTARAETIKDIERVREDTIQKLGNRLDDLEIQMQFSDVFELLARSEDALSE